MMTIRSMQLLCYLNYQHQCKSIETSSYYPPHTLLYLSKPQTKKNSNRRSNSLGEEFDVIPVQSDDVTDMQEGVVVSQVEREFPGGELVSQVCGFGNDGMLSLEGFSSSGNGFGDGDGNGNQEDLDRLIDKSINGTFVLAADTFALTKLIIIDQNYWQVALKIKGTP